MQGWFAKFTLYLQAKHTYLRNLGASPRKPRMFLCSFNVAGVVFKKKTDRGREGLVLLWTAPLLKRDWHENFTNQGIPSLYPSATFAHFSLPSVHLLQRKCSWFLLPYGLCGYCKINLLDKTLGAPDPSWILSKKHTNNSWRQCFDCYSQHQEQSLSGSCHFQSCAATATVYQSTHTHTNAQIHTQSAAAQDPDCPDIYADPGGGKGKSWLKCTG